MAEAVDKTENQQLALKQAIATDSYDKMGAMLSELPAPDIAHLIESSPPRERSVIWQLVAKAADLEESEILQHLSEEVRNPYLSTLNHNQITNLVLDLDNDDGADVLQELPSRVAERVLNALDEQKRNRLQVVLSYHEDSAGGLMNTDFITVRPTITLEVVFKHLRAQNVLPKTTDTLYVVDRQNTLVGLLTVEKLLVGDLEQRVCDIMQTEPDPITAETKAHEVAQKFAQRDLVTAPVVDEHNHLVGRITVDDVVDVIRDEADHSIMSMAGLEEGCDTFAPIVKTARGRALWLGINLLTAILASTVIGAFQETLTQLIALAILMPIVANMGGVAGNQTLTLMIRNMAAGHLTNSNRSWLIGRELGVAAINGLLWALATAVLASIWFNDYKIAVIIGIAMIITLFVAALSGALLPMALKKIKIDPALAGGVILTTITDVVGFLSFLGLATLLYF